MKGLDRRAAGALGTGEAIAGCWDGQGLLCDSPKPRIHIGLAHNSPYMAASTPGSWLDARLGLDTRLGPVSMAASIPDSTARPARPLA